MSLIDYTLGIEELLGAKTHSKVRCLPVDTAVGAAGYEALLRIWPFLPVLKRPGRRIVSSQTKHGGKGNGRLAVNQDRNL